MIYWQILPAKYYENQLLATRHSPPSVQWFVINYNKL